MASSLDMFLDDIISRNKGHGRRGAGTEAGRRVSKNNPGGRGHGRGRGAAFSGSTYGPSRRFLHRDLSRHRPYSMPPAMIMPDPPMMLSTRRASGESGTKLYISNLDYGVSSHDISVLFHDFGDLKRYSLHYDENGKSKGTAEVVFADHADALAAIERYNNVHLDGKPMRVEIVGSSWSIPPFVQVPLTTTSNLENISGGFRCGQESFGTRRQKRAGFRSQVWYPRGQERAGFCSQEGYPRGQERAGFRSQEGYPRGQERAGFRSQEGYPRGQVQGRRCGEKVTADELDADLERYRFEAMHIN